DQLLGPGTLARIEAGDGVGEGAVGERSPPDGAQDVQRRAAARRDAPQVLLAPPPSNMPVRGEDGPATSRRGMRPARQARRPASTARRMARAMATEYAASAIAVFNSNTVTTCSRVIP